MFRYKRQKAFEPFGESAQWRLQTGRVLIVGCGALGGTVADLLVRAGVGIDGGLVVLMDHDVVHRDNLHRQTIFTERDADQARFKVRAAKEAVLAANRQARVKVFAQRFEGVVPDVVPRFDLFIDATDDFKTRFLMNRIAVRDRIPFVSAGVAGASGQLICVLPFETACLECLIDGTADNVMPEQYGILPPLPSIFASLEAMEAMKILGGRLEAVNRSLLSVDLWNNRFSTIRTERNGRCPVCGNSAESKKERRDT